MSERAHSALEGLSLASTGLHPDDIAARAAEEAVKLGILDLSIHLADLEQRSLVHLAKIGEPQSAPMSIDASVAGRAYRTESPVPAEGEGDGDAVLWLPLLDSAERLGVIGVRTPAPLDGDSIDGVLAFTNLLAEVIANKASYGDVIAQARRTRDLSVAAETRWAMLPPLTFSGRNLTISGILEPAYDIAGDTFDYAVNGDTAFVAIFDAVGHNLEAARIANLAVITYRHARRRDLGPVETYLSMDDTISGQFGTEKFVTAQLARLALATGELSWLNAGHPPPMIVRRGHRIDLPSEVAMPVGLASYAATDVPLGQVRLEPGDLVLFFTDGVVEARSEAGDEFGRDRLGLLVERAAAAGQTVAETMRMLGHAVVDHQPGALQDDASLVVLAWHGPA